MKYILYTILATALIFSSCKTKKIQEAKTTEVVEEAEIVEEVEEVVQKTKEEDSKFKTSIGEAVPQFTFEATDGKTYSMKDFKGKTVWLNFFATWCGPCLVEIPELNKLTVQYEDVVFISIGREHTVEELIPFAEKKKMTYIVGADPERAVYNLFADKYIPRNYLINKEGKIEHQEIGYNAEGFQKLVADMEKMIR